VIGLAWAAGIYWLEPAYAWWMLPVLGSLALSIPVSVYSSRVSLGRRLRDAGLFLIPEESEVPHELRIAGVHASRAGEGPRFIDAVVDPDVNAIAGAVSQHHARSSARMQSHRERVIAAAVQRGPDALTDHQKLFFLANPPALVQLHQQIRISPAAHPGWHVARLAAVFSDRAALRSAS
jgi:membrane glycosyltransferase